MTHDDNTIQAAIDAAFQTNGDEHGGTLITSKHHIAWPREALARFAVAKAFLAALPTAEQSAEIERLKAELASLQQWKTERLQVSLTCTARPAQPWAPAVGDVVRLKSGGPQVTVKALTSDGLASCIWFDPNGQYHQLPVPVATLELVRKEKP